ncbi:Lar family restriction alleviation protein [Escherichia coli]|nr:Lar family restriction alleviation protein [Escherichia coli]MBB8072624.1 Lar family restriction alleviation protein [Escherichia coli]
MQTMTCVTSDVALKPCPFCGNPEVQLIEVKYFLDGDDGYYVACTCCNANQLPDSKERAIHDWNQRDGVGVE